MKKIVTPKPKKAPQKPAKTTIGLSGAKGSFSEEAARQYAVKHHIKNPTFQYLISVENALQALEDKVCDIAIFPVANSIGGIVIEAVYATARHLFEVQELFSIEIHQNLLITKGAKAGDITVITSHDQALKQCKSYFERVWSGVKIREYPDTAKAAQDLSTGVLPSTTAVVASKAAAKLYKLEILEASIQDLKTNYTTFVAAKRG